MNASNGKNSAPSHLSLVKGAPGHLERLWANYTTARAAAERSANIRDGMAAGQAWAAWLAAFSEETGGLIASVSLGGPIARH